MTDLEDDAKICKHCSRLLISGYFGFSSYLLNTGVFILAIGGFFFWPMWIAAILIAVVINVRT